jgi:hypothetical protein
MKTRPRYEVMTLPRTTKDILAYADELAKQFEDYQPREGDRRDAAVLAAQRAAPAPAPKPSVSSSTTSSQRKHGLPW